MTKLHDPPQADLQLAVIARLASALDDHGIDYWLFGEWAVVFWVGSVTRDYDDIGRGRAMVRSGVEFTFVVTSPNGGTFIPFHEPVRWSADPFGADRQTLKGVVDRVIPLPILVAGKQPFNQGVDREPSDKNRRYYKALSTLDPATDRRRAPR